MLVTEISVQYLRDLIAAQSMISPVWHQLYRLQRRKQPWPLSSENESRCTDKDQVGARSVPVGLHLRPFRLEVRMSSMVARMADIRSLSFRVLHPLVVELVRPRLLSYPLLGYLTRGWCRVYLFLVRSLSLLV